MQVGDDWTFVHPSLRLNDPKLPPPGQNHSVLRSQESRLLPAQMETRVAPALFTKAQGQGPAHLVAHPGTTPFRPLAQRTLAVRQIDLRLEPGASPLQRTAALNSGENTPWRKAGLSI